MLCEKHRCGDKGVRGWAVPPFAQGGKYEGDSGVAGESDDASDYWGESSDAQAWGDGGDNDEDDDEDED